MNLKSKCFVLALGHRSAATPLRAVGLALALSVLAGQAQSAELPVVAVQSAQRAQTATYDGQVEALRQAVIAAQVPGSVLELNVRAALACADCALTCARAARYWLSACSSAPLLM